MSERAKRYRAFISYSQKDKTYARRLHRALESYRLPRGVEAEGVDARARKLGRFFRDDEEMGAATDLGAALQGAIADAESLVVVCSPHAARSRWVNEEIIHFKRTGRAGRIFAVIVAGEPNGAREDKECLPPALRFELGDDGALSNRPAEPLGIDVRNEPFNRLIARLAAGLIGLPFDTLWKREQRRARARAATNSLVIGLVAVIISGAVTQGLWRPRLDAYLRYERFSQSSAELMTARSGTAFQDCQDGSTDCPTMVVLPAGVFMMGSAQNEPDANAREQPQHEVTIRRFAVSINDITFADWQVCVRSGGCRSNPNPDDANWGRETRPVIDVSWDDVQEYVAWLSRITGQRYRLLSEAEWEYAARGHTSLQAHYQYPWGNDPPVCEEHAPNGAAFEACSERTTLPVGSFRHNAFGLHDMAGNVNQWVADCYHEDYDGAPTDGSAWTHDGCDSRVVRGSSWLSGASEMRIASRYGDSPLYRLTGLGFRVARTL